MVQPVTWSFAPLNFDVIPFDEAVGPAMGLCAWPRISRRDHPQVFARTTPSTWSHASAWQSQRFYAWRAAAGVRTHSCARQVSLRGYRSPISEAAETYGSQDSSTARSGLARLTNMSPTAYLSSVAMSRCSHTTSEGRKRVSVGP
jgi:hypothetical protein